MPSILHRFATGIAFVMYALLLTLHAQAAGTAAAAEAAIKVLPGEHLLAVARAAVSAAGLPAAPVGANTMPRDLVLPAGDVKLSARPLLGTGRETQQLVWIDIAVDGRFLRAAAIGIVLRKLRPVAPVVPTAVRAAPIPAAEPAGDLNGLAGTGATVPTPGPGGAQKPGVMGGVMRGEWASLHARSGALTLEKRVRVLDDGQPGQTVRVRPQGATAPLSALVIDRHALKVIE